MLLSIQAKAHLAGRCDGRLGDGNAGGSIIPMKACSTIRALCTCDSYSSQSLPRRKVSATDDSQAGFAIPLIEPPYLRLTSQPATSPKILYRKLNLSEWGSHRFSICCSMRSFPENFGMVLARPTA